MPDVKHYRRKLCLLGDAAVGKTSLIRRYVEDRFDDRYLVTLGTKVTMKEMYLKIPDNGQHLKITLMIWDILGQREPKRLHTTFYNGANGAFVVADITRKETIAALEGWILSLFNTVGRVPILLLVNKIDLLEQSAIEPEEIQDLARKYNTSYVLTSAKTGENVEKAFFKMSEVLVAKDTKKIPLYSS